MGFRAHGCNRFAGKNVLTLLSVDPVHASYNNMISSTWIDNQELTVGPERTRIQNHAIARRNNLRGFPRLKMNSLGWRSIWSDCPNPMNIFPWTGKGRSP